MIYECIVCYEEFESSFEPDSNEDGYCCERCLN